MFRKLKKRLKHYYKKENNNPDLTLKSRRQAEIRNLITILDCSRKIDINIKQWVTRAVVEDRLDKIINNPGEAGKHNHLKIKS